MPELPEVETVVRSLSPRLCGRTITRVQTSVQRLRQPWRPEWSERLRGARIAAIRRRGKWIVMELDGGACLIVHLGMTGRLRVVLAEEPVEPHTHLVFRLDDGREELRFRDVRRFGSATLLAADEVEAFFAEKELGPEPFELTLEAFARSLKRTSRCLKAVLLDQTVVAGVGNIYADEALFEAKLHPRRVGRRLKKEDANRLRRAVVKVLQRAIERKGSTIRDYVDGNGDSGGYQREFRAYGRTGEPCIRCRTLIRQVRLAGRSTHFCPRCQRR